MFLLLDHEEVYLRKDALQDRFKPATGSEEVIYFSTSSWDHFLNFIVILFDHSDICGFLYNFSLIIINFRLIWFCFKK